MRDPKRIDVFCDELKAVWHRLPDWRFGQFLSNAIGEYIMETKKDIFFTEDDEMLEFFKRYVSSDEDVNESGTSGEDGNE